MKVKEINSKKLSREFIITIPYGEIDSSINVKINEIIPTLTLPGFRKGKAPHNIVKKKYENNVLGEIIEKIVKDKTLKILDEKKLKPFRQPKIEITKYKKNEPIELNIKIDIQPEFTITSFEKIQTNKYQIKIDKKTYQENYENYISSQKTYVKLSKNRAIVKGDKVFVDIESDDQSLPDHLRSQKNISLITDSDYQILPDISDKLIKKESKFGDKIKINFDLTKFLKQDKKKLVSFLITIKEIQEPKQLIIDKDFLEKQNFQSETEYRKKIDETIESQYNNQVQAVEKKILMDLLENKHKFEVPEGIFEEEFKIIWDRVQKAKENNQLDEDDKKLSDAKLMKRYQKIALRRVKLAILMQKIAEENSITVTEKELTEALINYASQYPGQERQIFDYFKNNPAQLESIKAPIFENKIIDYISSKTKNKNIEISIKQFIKLQEDTFNFKEVV